MFYSKCLTRDKPGKHTSVERAKAKARRKLALLRKLAGTQWGAQETVLRNVYIGTIRPHLEYGSTTQLNKDQHIIIIIIIV